MTDLGRRAELDEHWRQLGLGRPTKEGALRVSDLSVDTARGAVSAGMDSAGCRHLLIPIGSHQAVRRGVDGPVLQLRSRPLESANEYQNYADLACLQPAFDGVFTTLCIDVLEAVSSSTSNPIKGLYTALDTWRALFQTAGRRLGPEQLAGLFGELLLLRRMLELNSSAQGLWKGPTCYRHDFSSAKRALEVKASTASEGRRIRVHGLDQLDAPLGGELCLVWFRLERNDSGGTTVQGIVDQVLELADDTVGLLAQLHEAGYRASDIAHYSEVGFAVSEERWYRVDSEFPRLTAGMLAEAGVTVNVRDVEYSVELTSEPPDALSDEQATKYLLTMIEEMA
ncbi:PD-(D/E)XK motif protein [Nocardia tengchongensis]|uniref:PD-(D/E)XK motif protein n=1 Tax=Nocardia tengchongensis TaxID=2055889 RepID=UPI00369CFD00